MTWAKLSDDYTDDLWSLSDAAYRLHTDGLVWNGRKLLDLRIPKQDVLRFAKDPDAVAELLQQGFWLDSGDAYTIRHHGQYQRSREQVIAQQAVNRKNGGRGGRPKGKSREQVNDVTHKKTESQSESLTESKTEAITESFRPARKTESVMKPATSRHKTESLTESLSGTKTERDRTGIYEEVLPSSAENPYPTDPKAIEYRRRIEELNIMSVDQLVEAARVPRDMAAKMWADAFPGGRVA